MENRYRLSASNLIGAVLWSIVSTASSANDFTNCNTIKYGPNQMFSNTSCTTTTKKTRPKSFLSPQGVVHYKSGSTYCYKNDYGKERCLDPLDAKGLQCQEADGQVICF